MRKFFVFASGGFLEVLELAAELEVVTVGKLHFVVNGPRGLLHEAFGVASTHVDEDADAALRIFTGDLHGLRHEDDLGDLAEREHSAVFGAQGEAFDAFEVAAAVFAEADDDGAAAVAFDDEADFRSSERGFDEAVQFIGVDIEFAHGLAGRLDFDHGVLADAVELRLATAWDGGDGGAHLSGEAFEFVVAVAEDFAHEVGACSGHDLVEAHLDGLGDEDGFGWGRFELRSSSATPLPLKTLLFFLRCVLLGAKAVGVVDCLVAIRQRCARKDTGHRKIEQNRLSRRTHTPKY